MYLVWTTLKTNNQRTHKDSESGRFNWDNPVKQKDHQHDQEASLDCNNDKSINMCTTSFGVIAPTLNYERMNQSKHV